MLEDLLQDSWTSTDDTGDHQSVDTSTSSEETEPEPEPVVHPVVEDLRQRLEVEGYVLQQHVGSGPHAVPLAIEDPHRPGRLLVAIDLDVEPAVIPPGRDSTRLRVEQLSRLGWEPVRVLSTNLFRDPAREVAALVSLVRQSASRTGSTG
jgi:lambda repressor-like predicted transcriptional regulator